MSNNKNPHIVFFPSPGMGHLTPFLRLASLLSSRNCQITLIKTHPVSPEESAQFSIFFSGHPNVNKLDFNITQEKTSDSHTDDPFISQFKAINSSIHLLPNLLSSIPDKISAIFSDFVVAATLSKLSYTLGFPNFIVSTTSARCYSTVAYLPTLLSDGFAKLDHFPKEIKIPGLTPLSRSSIPPAWLDNSPSNRLLKDYLVPNSLALPNVNGILLNSFDWFEPETILALLDNKVLGDLPTLYPIGPLEPYKSEKKHDQPWLDSKPEKSVVYVNLGGGTILSVDQIREIGKGLEKSGHFFLWVLKETRNDNEFQDFLERAKSKGETINDNEFQDFLERAKSKGEAINCNEFQDFLERVKNKKETINENEFQDFLERTKNKGIVVKGVVNQAGILAHPAIGGFVSQCDWDSVTEAVQEGVPMLMWPRHGDHKMNSEVAEKAGFGIWVKEWGWGGERVVRGEEIEGRVRELMENMVLKAKAEKAKEEARRGYEVGGSSDNALMKLFHLLKQKDVE